MHANIQPVSIWFGKQPQSGVVLEAIAIVAPNVGAKVEWRILNPQAQIVAQGMEEMTGDTFAAWGSDDSYVYQWLGAVLGLTILEIVNPPPQAPAPALVDSGPGNDGFLESPAN